MASRTPTVQITLVSCPLAANVYGSRHLDVIGKRVVSCMEEIYKK